MRTLVKPPIMYVRFFLAAAITMIWPALHAQDLSAYRKETFSSNGIVLPYRLLSPVVNAGKQYPLVIFLHGGYEKGNDNERQLAIGGKFFLTDSVRVQYPAYVLFPQCPAGDAWVYFENEIDFATGHASEWRFPFYKQPTAATAALKKLIDSLSATGKIDPARIYLMGFSQGGMGTLDCIARFPNLFAAAIAICGAGESATTRLFTGKVPLWLFHGEKDEVVPVEFSRDYARRLKKSGSQARYTEYRGEGHDISRRFFEEKEWLTWLFGQHRQ